MFGTFYKRKMNKALAVLLGLTMGFGLTGCGENEVTYDGFTAQVAEESSLTPVDSMLNTESYAGEEALPEEAKAVFESDDGLCRIEKKPSYFEIYLDYTGGDFYATGAAYGETIKKTGIEYGELLEPYLYENIKMAFPNLNGDYSPIRDRIKTLTASLPEQYRQEMDGFATAISGGEKGFIENGKISYEEAMLANMVPDCLRGTNCNALSVWGEKTETGERIVSRTLEWSLGSENQMCLAQAVTHFKMPEGKQSYTTFSVMGMLDVLTGINESGVFAGILDVGSIDNYVYEGKKCYTYELRYALENMSDARSIGEYMVAESGNFTYSHNVIITDEKDCFVAEDYADPGEEARLASEQDSEKSKEHDGDEPEERRGHSVLRDKDTPLMDGVTWDNPDSLCVINSFMTEGNEDSFTSSGSNYVRFTKFNAWVGEKEKLSLSDVKDLVTREKQDRASRYQKLHSENVFHTIIYDYATGELDITFTGTEGVVNHPKYVRVSLDQ